MNEHQDDDQWLNDLLAQPPVLRDNGFTANTWQRITAYQKRRQLVFAGVWILALVIFLLVSPWTNVSDWLSLVSASEHSLWNQLNTTLLSADRQQIVELLQNNWAIMFAGCAIVVVFFRNLFIEA